MFPAKNKKRIFKKGSVAVFALIIMFILSIATIGIITTAAIERKVSISTGNSTTAFQVAESGMESTLQSFKDHFDEKLSAIGCVDISGGEKGINLSNNKIKFRKRGAAASVYASCDDYIYDIGVIKSIGTTKRETRAIEEDVFLGATKLLLHLDGKNPSGDFEDSSFYYDKNNPIEINGNADILESTEPNKFNTLNAAFDDTGYLSVNVGVDNRDFFNFGDKDFTIDFWMYPDVITIPRAGLIIQEQNANNGWWIELNNATVSFFSKDGGDNVCQISSSTDVSIGSWYHIAAVQKKGSGFKLFINGELKGSDNSNDTMPNLGNKELKIGSSVGDFNGFIDEIRISKGVARWNSDFSGRLPSDPYQAD